MKIITCAGYHGTGSSVVTDLLSEFKGVKSLGNYEFRFIQDPYGISDLEYNLVENNHRLNSSNSIKKFKKNIDFLSRGYEKYFDGFFKKISYDYINSLVDLEYRCGWHQDLIEKGIIYYYFSRIITRPINAIYKIIKRDKEAIVPLFKNEKFYLSVPREKFYLETKKYLNLLFKIVGEKSNSNILAFDQLVPPTNTNRYAQYFDNINIIIIDRDPRDLYILAKYKWKDTIVPTNNVDTFIKWYKKTREHINYEADYKKTIRLKFEDFVYKYDDTLDIIYKFLEIEKENHINKKKYFNPDISIKNIKVWEKGNYKEDIDKIYKELRDFCYEK